MALHTGPSNRSDSCEHFACAQMPVCRLVGHPAGFALAAVVAHDADSQAYLGGKGIFIHLCLASCTRTARSRLPSCPLSPQKLRRGMAYIAKYLLAMVVVRAACARLRALECF